MARPIPRVEPVMTATFPFMSNRLMFLSRCLYLRPNLRQACRVPTTSGELAFGCDDLRPRRLMHGGVSWIGNPRLLVDHWKPPAGGVLAAKMLEPRHRTIVDIERKSLFHLAAKCKADRRLDRAAVADGDDVVTGLLDRDPLDRGPGTVVEVHETLTAG